MAVETVSRAGTMRAAKTMRRAGCVALALLLVCAVAARAGSKDKRGYLGIEFHDTSDETIIALHMQGPRGAEVAMVDHDGPAGKAGLQPHDIVLQIDGQNIDAAEVLSRTIRESAPGRVVSLSVLRNGRMMTMSAKLADREELERKAWKDHRSSLPRPSEDSIDNVLVERYTVETAPAPKAPSRGQNFIGTVLRTGPYTGATLETMEPQLAGFFGAPPKTGLLVHAVDANSPAEAAGLRAGDVVLRVDSVAVASTSDWTKQVRNSKGRAMTLLVLRDRHEQTLSLMPDAKRHSMLQMPSLPFHPFSFTC